MKSWFLFGTGLVMGITLGALGAAFFLFDEEVSKKSLGSGPAVTATHRIPRSVKKAEGVDLATQPDTATATPEVKPAAVAAEAVDIDSLPDAEKEPVISTVKREEESSSAPPASQPH